MFKFGEMPSVSPTEPGFWTVNEYVNSDKPPGSLEQSADARDFQGQAEAN